MDSQVKLTLTPEETAAIESRILQEAKELESAPKVPVKALQPSAHQFYGAGRCHVCGQWSEHLIDAHDFDFNNKVSRERWVGKDCCGARYIR